MRRLRLAFLGTPDFAVPSLRALLAAGHEIAAVYTQPPRPAGRGKKPRCSPVQSLAEARGLELRLPASLKDAGVQADFAGLGLDAAAVVAYGLLLPPPVLAAPRLGCLNAHASLLPRWRGAAPIQRAILAGDGETGVTIMRLDEGLDTGPILAAERLAIGPRMTAGELHDRLAELAAPLLVATLADFAAGRLAPRPQPEAGVTYAAKLTPAEGRLDWRRPAEELERRVRACTPQPGAWFETAGTRVKVLAAEVVAASGATPPGRLLDDRLTIACGAGALRPTRLQRAGGAALAAAAFLRGFPLPAGTVLP